MMMRYLIPAIIAALLLGYPSGDAGAETIYRWTDSAGTVHFGSRPPSGVEAEQVDMTAVQSMPVQPATQQGIEAGETTTSPDEGTVASPAQKARAERTRKRAERDAEQANIEARCEAMREQLAWSEPSPRVIVRDEEGTIRRLDNEERLELVNESKAYIAANCE